EETYVATVDPEPAGMETMADLLERLGGIPLERIRARPAPGTATEGDMIAALEAPRKRFCGLGEGVLVEKAVGIKEALLANVISHFLWSYLEKNDLGAVVGADGPWRLLAGLVRLPDVAFISWDRLPNRELPEGPVADLAPDLAVEVLSQGNTKKEMQ